MKLAVSKQCKMVFGRLLQISFAHEGLAVLASCLIYLIWNKFYHGLNKYNGPFLASLTDWWRLWDVWNRRAEITHMALHQRYGDIVRLGPNYLSFSCPAALKEIYGLKSGVTKV